MTSLQVNEVGHARLSAGVAAAAVCLWLTWGGNGRGLSSLTLWRALMPAGSRGSPRVSSCVAGSPRTRWTPRHARPRASSTPTARAAAGLTHPADGHERWLGPVSGMHRTRAGARLATLPNAARGTHGPHCGLSAGRFFEVLGQCVSAGGVERLAGCAGGAGDRRPQSIMLCRGFSAARIRWPTWYPPARSATTHAAPQSATVSAAAVRSLPGRGALPAAGNGV
jgi:hypothetical protein